MRGFGEAHNVIWFDEEEASDGMRSVKTVFWDVCLGCAM
jgi:hypothetical protein